MVKKKTDLFLCFFFCWWRVEHDGLLTTEGDNIHNTLVANTNLSLLH